MISKNVQNEVIKPPSPSLAEMHNPAYHLNQNPIDFPYLTTHSQSLFDDYSNPIYAIIDYAPSAKETCELSLDLLMHIRRTHHPQVDDSMHQPFVS